MSLLVGSSADESSRLLMPREVADRLRVSLSMVRKLVRRGDLPAVSVGRVGGADLRGLVAVLAIVHRTTGVRGLFDPGVR